MSEILGSSALVTRCSHKTYFDVVLRFVNLSIGITESKPITMSINAKNMLVEISDRP